MAALAEVRITFGASRLSAKAFIEVKDTRYAHRERYSISLRLCAGQKSDIYIAQGNHYLFSEEGSSVLKSVRVRYSYLPISKAANATGPLNGLCLLRLFAT